MTKYLNKDILVEFHKNQIEQYGGSQGIRDEGLLESALAQPEASFGGQDLQQSLFEKAAAYGFHLCMNHPFYDGNKRIALIAMYTFLHVNGYRITADKKSIFAVMVDLASGSIPKDELADFLKNNSEKRS